MTKTSKIGYVAALPLPELFRHMNAFAVGVKEVNPEAAITGQLTDGGPLVVQMLEDVKAGKADDLTDYDLLYLLDSGAVELDADWNNKINPKYVDAFKGMMTKSADFGTIRIGHIFGEMNYQLDNFVTPTP